MHNPLETGFSGMIAGLTTNRIPMNEFNHDDEQLISKTKRKSQMHDLQALGGELTKLAPATLKKLALPEDLLEALLAYQRINSNGALKRQMQYIGRLMRDIDPEPVRQYLAIRQGDSTAHNAWLHRIERWRERLLSDDTALQTLISEFPLADAQQLRTLIRNARKEQSENKPPKHYRALFQSLKTLLPEPFNPLMHREEEDETDE